MSGASGQIIALFTGQSGVNKAPQINALKQVSEASGRRVAVFSLGSMMYKQTAAPAGRILRLPLGQLQLARRQVVHDICDFISSNPATDVFVDTHATFRWEDGLFSGFTPQEILSLRPTICICFVADVEQVNWASPSRLPVAALAQGHHVLARGRNALLRTDSRDREPAAFVNLSFLLSCAISPHQCSKRSESLSKVSLSVESHHRRWFIKEFRVAFAAIDSIIVFDPMEIVPNPSYSWRPTSSSPTTRRQLRSPFVVAIRRYFCRYPS